MKFVTLVLGTLVSSQVLAAAEDILYVHGNSVNMRGGPSTSNNVVLKFQDGHKLIEIQRKGEWVEIRPYGTSGTSGWIHSSLVRAEPSGRTTRALANSGYDKFIIVFNKLNERVKKEVGYEFFTSAEDLGDGFIQITATDTWLDGSLSDRESNLRTIFQLWDAADESRLPIAVYVIDETGNRRMSMTR